MKKVILISNSEQTFRLVDREFLKARGIATIPLVIKEKDFSYQHLLQMLESERPDFVCCYYDRFMSVVGRVREALQLPGLHESEVLSLIDKRQAASAVSAVVKTPATSNITTTDDYRNLCKKLSCKKLFIKPHTRSGSEATFVIENQQSLDTFFVRHASELEEFVVQEYIDAPLYHVDMVVQEGQEKFVSVREYSAPNHLMLSEHQPLFSLPLRELNKKQALIEAAQRARVALGFDSGVMHSEFYFPDGGEPIFLEINIRHPGIGINHLYQKTLGISFETMMVLLEAGENLPALSPGNMEAFCGYFPQLPGVIKDITPPEIASAHTLTYFVKKGQRCEKKACLSKAVAVLVWDNDIEQLLRSYQQVSQHRFLQMQE